ncbi:MAG TPA: hypothetical protein PLV48_03445 [Rhodocyclaceae bacterium]|nr:hypothetical protein [Rhodocyclaceae bacterium]
MVLQDRGQAESVLWSAVDQAWRGMKATNDRPESKSAKRSTLALTVFLSVSMFGEESEIHD